VIIPILHFEAWGAFIYWTFRQEEIK
jgi:hypothetical protein